MTLTREDLIWVDLLNEWNQAHLLDGADTEGIKRLVAQVKELDSSYPGGLNMYVRRAKTLLSDSRENVNIFHGYTPAVPRGKILPTGSAEFFFYETLGLEHVGKLAFVLVAGGLGERLGFPDIKIGLPIETCSGMTYIEYYIEMIRACEAHAKSVTGVRPKLPLAVMTSDDTHARTLALLRAQNYFGFPEDQVTLMKQQKVPSLTDNQARFSTAPHDRYNIETKPHGHGDVHTLLNQHGLPLKWKEEGKEWMLIFQDTNGLVSHAVCPLLGVSKHHNYVMNSLSVPRKPGEAVGAICRLEGKEGPALTINVEYNQLSSLLEGNGMGGDTADPATGFSPFPGNANVLLFSLARYEEVLRVSGGVVPEFINPKYKDEAKNVFKTPTRLECLMQEFPRLLGPNDEVGITQLDRWFCFSAVKNNEVDAAAKSKSGGVPESPFTGEADEYNCYARMLEIAGKSASVEVQIGEAENVSMLGVNCLVGPLIVMHPSFAITVEHVKRRLKGGPIRIAKRSALMLEGDVTLDNVQVDGALVLKSASKLNVKSLEVKNQGWALEPLDGFSDQDVPLSIRIRGYRIKKHQETSIVVE